jgi:hypothetical protein
MKSREQVLLDLFDVIDTLSEVELRQIELRLNIRGVSLLAEVTKLKDAAKRAADTAMFAVKILEERNAALQEEIDRLKNQ